MNERLRECLVKQAGFHIRPSIENTVPGIDWNCGSYGYDQCVTQLIELIVKECTEICYHHSQAAGGADTMFGYGYKDCGDDIKRHFGVE